MRLIDADELSIKIIEEMEEAVKWGITAIADGEKEFRLKAEQAVESFCEALLLVKKMPTIDSVKYGKWIYSTNNESVCEEWTCNLCGAFSFEKTNFCHNCGADMREKEE